MHQVGNQSRLYYDAARSTNHQDIPVLLFSTAFFKSYHHWYTPEFFVRFLWNLSNWPPGNEMWDRRMCRCMWIRLIWHEIMSCGCITVDSCYMLFVLAIRFREIVGYIILQQWIAAYGNLRSYCSWRPWTVVYPSRSSGPPPFVLVAWLAISVDRKPCTPFDLSDCLVQCSEFREGQ